jgi:hypothetical protein
MATTTTILSAQMIIFAFKTNHHYAPIQHKTDLLFQETKTAHVQH